LADVAAIIQFEYWHIAKGIDRPESISVLLPVEQIHLHSGNFHALFCEKDAYASRIWCGLAVIELHGFCLVCVIGSCQRWPDSACRRIVQLHRSLVNLQGGSQ